MVRKRQDIYERQSQRRINNYMTSKLMGESHPDIEHITINLFYKDHDGFKAPEPKTMDYFKNSHAHFDLDCPYRECIGGGFNLTSQINSMISERQTELTDSMTCQGWQDLERINKFHCLLEVQFKIAIQYNNR